MKSKKTNVVGLFVVLACIGAGILIGACSMFEHEAVVITPLSIPGAEYVGSETCAGCHEAESNYFELTSHADVAVDITDEDAEAGQAEACETCHGPGSLHVEGQGDKSKIIRPTPETCFSCHLDIKGKFLLQHHHPVREGEMFCTECHDMHGSDVRAVAREGLLGGKDEKCFKCHKEMKGPFVFEHDAMREGCQVCHNAHGSINDKLLVAGQTTTCMRCHWETSFDQASPSLGGKTHNYYIGQGEECIDHHRAPHGSNIWRTLNR